MLDQRDVLLTSFHDSCEEEFVSYIAATSNHVSDPRISTHFYNNIVQAFLEQIYNFGDIYVQDAITESTAPCCLSSCHFWSCIGTSNSPSFASSRVSLGRIRTSVRMSCGHFIKLSCILSICPYFYRSCLCTLMERYIECLLICLTFLSL